MTCHIGDGDHMLEHGRISYLNQAAARAGCEPGQTVRECARRMVTAEMPSGRLEPVQHEGRFLLGDAGRCVMCADSIVMLRPDDAGVTRLGHLDGRAIPAGAVTVASAPVGDARAIYRDGVLSRVNRTAAAMGISPGQALCDALEHLLRQAAPGKA